MIRSKMNVLSALLLMVAHASSITYCGENMFDNRQPGVQFTKELSTAEYGAVGTFKTLHCCGEKYLSLEWFKDNKPYPWPGDISSFILNPESANQTIYTRNLLPSDHGVYTCQLANHTTLINHSVKLVTIDVKAYWGDPLPTYQMPKVHTALPGESVRLYCEGFVGNIDLPDAINTIFWKKVEQNQTIALRAKLKTKIITRENNQIMGAFLFINQIEETDYGQYMCTISNTDDQIIQLYTNITKTVFKEQPKKKIRQEFKLIICAMIGLIFLIWQRRWFCIAYQKLKKKLENDKYTLSEKNVYSVVVFYDAENNENAQYFVEKMEHRENYIIKSYCINFDSEFINTHTDLAKGYDFAVYLLSSDDTLTSSLTKSTLKSFIQDNASPKKYIIDCGEMSVTPTKSWCDRILTDLSSGSTKQTHQNTSNKLTRAV